METMTANFPDEEILHIQRESTVSGLYVNFDRAEVIRADGRRYRRLCIKTPLLKREDNLSKVICDCAGPFLQSGDILVISEKIVAITQGRAMPIKDVKPSRLARFLSRFVTKTPYGIGLAMPETMECALQECGRFRILMASAVGAMGKLFHKKGWFYKVAGIQAAGIDGPCDVTIPPYNKWVVLSPENPDQVARELRDALGVAGTEVAIIDYNDLGGEILGWSSPEMDLELLKKTLADNPLGQGDDQTPVGIVRLA